MKAALEIITVLEIITLREGMDQYMIHCRKAKEDAG